MWDGTLGKHSKRLEHVLTKRPGRERRLGNVQVQNLQWEAWFGRSDGQACGRTARSFATQTFNVRARQSSRRRKRSMQTKRKRSDEPNGWKRQHRDTADNNAKVPFDFTEENYEKVRWRKA